ncbi:TRAP transporter large permease subunit [Aurantimonas sp. A2-1-M11]|uniref:TRAP transporter large permease subunit n=1 Tax=Aurantimonas sp. A2-1-M11 TaxID=3113712 RepID=UPI002F93713E
MFGLTVCARQLATASPMARGISGSATADTASIGAIMIPAMKRQGYDSDFTVALTACSSTCGPIIPPSITLRLLRWRLSMRCSSECLSIVIFHQG